MNRKGIDISKHNGSVDFTKLKYSDVEYVIIRGGFGSLESQKDVRFEENYQKAKQAGMPIGAYWYSYAVNIAQAKAEAEMCLKVIKGKQFEYPIYFDIEEQSAFATGKANCSAMVKTFCDTLEKAGYFAGFYISRSPLQTYITPEVANRYALWVAEYNTKCNYNGSYGMWQCCSDGCVNGVNGRVDIDYCYVDYPTIIKRKGLNGYAKQTESTNVQKPVENVEKPKSYAFKVGETVTISSGYKSSDAPEKEAIIFKKWKTGTIRRIAQGAKNPYYVKNKTGTCDCWCNAGDIRGLK